MDGEVHLKYIVNVDSSVSDVTVLKGPEVFHRAATDAVLQWRFKPAEHKGKVVPVSMLAPIGFSPEPDKGFDVWSVDVKPVLTNRVEPIYPDKARKTGLMGNVFLKFKVNEDGSVSDVRALKGRSVFVKPAIDAISQYRFKPAEHEGKPVAVWVTHRIILKPPKPKAVATADSGDADSDKVLEIRSVDAKPVVIHSVQPVYPNITKKAGLAGSVVLKFKVNVDGSVSDVDAFVLKGGEIFRKPAIEAVRQFLYKPAEHEGKPVAVWMTQHFTFAPPEHQDDTAPDPSDPRVGN